MDVEQQRGAVYCEEAYAQGKMLDNSTWKLPRAITPSDIDLCFDNNGDLLVCELSSSECEWRMLKRGQRLLYEALTQSPKVLAVLLNHDVPKTSKINTYLDITYFQVFFHDKSRIVFSPVWPGSAWPRFVEKWYDDPQAMRAACLVRTTSASPSLPQPEELRDPEYIPSCRRPLEPWTEHSQAQQQTGLW